MDAPTRAAAMTGAPKLEEGSIPGIEGLTGKARAEAMVEQVRLYNHGPHTNYVLPTQPVAAQRSAVGE